MLQNFNVIAACVKAKLYSFLHDERGDVNIVSIVVLIGIAVILAVLFKDAIGGLITSLLETIEKGATGAVTETVGGGIAGGD